jgi:hypothetical protein
MGLPYASELERLPGTYQWSRQEDVSQLTRFIAGIAESSACFVGSGGSFTTAAFASFLHEYYARRLARASTPLESAASFALASCPAMFFSASGKNADIVGAFRAVAGKKPPALGALCAVSQSPLLALANEYPFASYCGYDLPSGGDGFVATNSLVMSIVMLMNAYSVAVGAANTLPEWESVLGEYPTQSVTNRWFAETEELWRYPNLLVLHGPAGRPAALDVESRFHEAALAAVQVADFRNFGHGRHHWLKRMHGTTGILSLESREDEDISRRTFTLIPENIPRGRIRVNADGPKAAMALILASIYLAGRSGIAVNVDPGCPEVADFGRQISRLNVWNPPAEAPAATHLR